MKPQITIHKAGQGFIGRLDANDARSSQHQTKQGKTTIFVLDRSGSMGQNARRMAHEVIPAVSKRLNNENSFTLITFDSVIETMTAQDLSRHTLQSRGTTCMAGVFAEITRVVRLSNNSHVCIVAISDGAVWDTTETLKAADLATSQLSPHYAIGATAIRLFTSSAQPDTRALASVLQLNTDRPGSIVDVRASGGTDSIVQTIVHAIGPLSSGSSLTLESATPCLVQAPWEEGCTKIHCNATNSKTNKPVTVWLNAIPKELTLNGLNVDIEFGDPVTHDTLHVLLDDKIAFYIDQLRIMRVLGSASSQEQLNRIINYFRSLEASLPPPSDLTPLLQDKSLAGRLKYTKASLSRRIKSISNTMQSIANDSRVGSLNMAQQADYLRQADGRCSRSLARRADVAGTDFSKVMRAEILSMAAHFDTLQVDDENHAVSFFSQATTMEGIRCMVELTREPDILNEMAASDLLRLFNVVGVPAVGPIGDFPDPMTYRLTKTLQGTYVSVADITMALHLGGNLIAPGQNEEIVTVVPFFEDNRVQQFLQRYARSSLEYICSVGMRRMIAEVPKTYPYTICAGIWKMVEELDRYGKSEARVRNFQYLVLSYEEAIKGCFEHILDHLEANDKPLLSYNLGHNGITNMIAPILHKVRNGEPLDMPRILRALYSFETYQVVRRLIREENCDPPTARQRALDSILGVDFCSSRATLLPPLFAKEADKDLPVHCSVAVIDVHSETLASFKKSIGFVPYATLLQPFFAAMINSENAVGELSAIPKMSPESIAAALDLPSSISLENFLVFNVVQALLYGNKASRVDKATNRPILGDLGIPGIGDAMIRDYVASRYAADYKKRLAAQSSEEKKMLQNKLVETMVNTQQMSVFKESIVHGIRRESVSVSIDAPNSPGFSQLHSRLLEATTVPLRAAKLYILYSGRSRQTGEPLFNSGNMLAGEWKTLQSVLESDGRQDLWARLQQELEERGHIYRGGSDVMNRHGHSNDHRSYYALGCRTLGEFYSRTSTAGWELYTAEHSHCCGVAHFVANRKAAQFL